MQEITMLGPLASLIGGSLGGALVGLLFIRQTTKIQNEIRTTFDRSVELQRERRNWDRWALTELYGPLIMHFERTKRALRAYMRTKDYREVEAIRAGNIAARDILLNKGHFIPAELLDHAGALVQHYERWLEAYDRQEAETKGKEPSSHVFARAEDQFPSSSEEAFREERNRLYDGLRAGK